MVGKTSISALALYAMAILSKIDVISTTDIPEAVKALPNSVKNSIKLFDELLFSIDSLCSIGITFVFDTMKTLW